MGISQQIGASSIIKPGVIDNTAARPASPYEGQVIFQKDTDQLLVWNGTAWVIPNSPAQNPQGLEFISSTTIGTTVSSVTVSSVFSATYDNYVIMISGGAASADSNIRIQLGATATGYYYGGMYAKYDGTVSSFAAVSNNTFWDIGYASTNALSGKAEIDSPFLAKRTIARTISTGSSTTYYMNNYAGFLDNATSYTAFTITISAGTMTGGTITVYGYRKV